MSFPDDDEGYCNYCGDWPCSCECEDCGHPTSDCRCLLPRYDDGPWKEVGNDLHVEFRQVGE